jgi:hypothetical protein
LEFVSSFLQIVIAIFFNPYFTLIYTTTIGIGQNTLQNLKGGFDYVLLLVTVLKFTIFYFWVSYRYLVYFLSFYVSIILLLYGEFNKNNDMDIKVTEEFNKNIDKNESNMDKENKKLN